MSSMLATALAALDDSLAALDATMQQFEAATPVELGASRRPTECRGRIRSQNSYICSVANA